MLTAFGAGLPLALALGLGLAVAVGPHATTTPTAAMDCRKRRRLIRPSRPISRPPPARSAADYKRLLRPARDVYNFERGQDRLSVPIKERSRRARRGQEPAPRVGVRTRCRDAHRKGPRGPHRPSFAPRPPTRRQAARSWRSR